jgi:hypothetical protein
MQPTKIILPIFLLIITLSANAQTYKAFVKAGDEAMAISEIYDAYSHYKMAMKIDSSDVKLWGKVAEAAHGFNLFEEADYYYNKIAEAGKYNEVYGFGENWLATKMAIGDYEKAQIIINKYNVPKAQKALDAAVKLKGNPIEIELKHLDENINTPYSDFAAQKVGDNFYYTSLRFKSENIQKEKIYIAKLVERSETGKGLPMKQRFNVKDKSTANAFWLNEDEVYYTVCEVVNEKQQCEIYYRKKENNRWGNAKKLTDKINQKGFTSTQPNVGFDSIEQKEYLFFVSDKSGKMTVWKSEILDNNQYGNPRLVKDIDDQTATENLTPFFDNQSQTLYFSSDRVGGLGNLDIYKTKRSRDKNGISGKWKSVENAGFPLNGSYNDIYFRLNNDGKTGYFSSNRKGSLSLLKKGACCYDIYEFELKEQPKERPIEPTNPPITSVEVPKNPTKGKVPNEPNQPTKPSEPIKNVVNIPPPKPTITPQEELSQFLPLALYFHNDEPNPRTWKTTTYVPYQESFKSYYRKRSEYVQKFTAPLAEAEKGVYENEINTFFEIKVAGGFSELLSFSDLLLKYLKAGENFEITLKGYASPIAKSDYNLNLSKRRVACIRNHFASYKSGVFYKYLDNGQLKIINSPFGETTAATSVSDKANDKRNSVYSVSAALERRVEILEIR